MARPKSRRSNNRGSTSSGRKLPTFVWAERAAGHSRHADRLAFIEREVPENWRAFVRAILPHFVVSRINEMPPGKARNDLIEDAIDFPRHDPAWARGFIETMTAQAGRGAW